MNINTSFSGYYPGPPPPPPAGFKGVFLGNGEGGIPASAPVSDPTNYGACNYPCLNQVCVTIMSIAKIIHVYISMFFVSCCPN